MLRSVNEEISTYRAEAKGFWGAVDCERSLDQPVCGMDLKQGEEGRTSLWIALGYFGEQEGVLVEIGQQWAS